MSTVHELKINPQYFDDVESGVKPFEVRVNDRDYQVGDILHLRACFAGDYNGKECRKLVTYILASPHYVKEGMVIMGLKDDDTERLDFLQANRRVGEIVVNGKKLDCWVYGITAGATVSLREAIDAWRGKDGVTL